MCTVKKYASEQLLVYVCNHEYTSSKNKKFQGRLGCSSTLKEIVINRDVMPFLLLLSCIFTLLRVELSYKQL